MMDAQQRIQRALRRVDIDFRCGVFKRLSESGKERMTKITYEFLTEYTKLLNDELEYNRSGDWLDWLDWLAYNVFHILPNKQKKKKGRGAIDRERGRSEKP